MVSRTLINTRKYILLYLFFELFLILLSNFLANITTVVDLFTKLYTIAILFFWPIFSYLANRYENIFIKKNLNHFFLKFILTSATIIFAYSFSATILDLFKICLSISTI